MSIVPSGKRREQVAQGGCRSASIFESDMFSQIAKYAQGMELKDQAKAKKPSTPKDLKMDELQQSLNESNTLPQEKKKTPLDAQRPQPQPQQPQPQPPQQPAGNPANSKDLKMDELQQNLQGDQGDQGDTGGGSEFIDISKRISQKVIDALGLSSRPGEHWAGKTEISNDGDEVIGITIKLTRAEPKDMMMQGRVEKNGPPLGAPVKENGPSGAPGGAPGPITNSV